MEILQSRQLRMIPSPRLITLIQFLYDSSTPRLTKPLVSKVERTVLLEEESHGKLNHKAATVRHFTSKEPLMSRLTNGKSTAKHVQK